MLKRFLAVLLVFSWIILSGYDVVEDLDLPDQTEVQNSIDDPIVGASSGVLARNIIESADYAPIHCQNLLEQFGFLKTTCVPHHSQKTSKLYKVHRVFLI
jgi:hypothetical protein